MNGIVDRTLLKRNFLKEIVMRLDFQGVLQAEMEKILIEAKPYLKKQSFNRYEEKISNHALFNNEMIKEATSQIIYSFYADDLGYSIELSTTSIILTANKTTYTPFEKYATIFTVISKIYIDKIDFLTLKRFGLRKINFCFIKKSEDIIKYFKESHYGINEIVSGFETENTARVLQLRNGFQNLNLNYQIQHGVLDKEVYYKVVFDADIYLTDEKNINTILVSVDQMSPINTVLFNAYCNALTDEFLAILSSENDELPEGMLGVEENE